MTAPTLGSHHQSVFSSLLLQAPDQDFAADENLFDEHAAADHALFIVSGRVAVEMLLDDARFVQIAERGAHELIGEMGLVSGRRFCRVRAIEPVRVVRVGYGLMIQLINARPDFAIALYTLATERLREACRRAANRAPGAK